VTLSRRIILHGICTLPAIAAALAGARSARAVSAIVHNGPELAAALHIAGPGSVVTLAPGDYGDVAGFVAPGGVTVRSLVPHRAALRAPLLLEGAGTDCDGLCHHEDMVVLAAGLLVQNQKFVGKTLTVSGTDTEVRNCEFSGSPSRMIDVTRTSRRAYIHHNTFRDGDAVAVGIGSGHATSNTLIAARVEHNTIRNIKGRSNEIICVKSSGNLISANMVSGGHGHLSNRHGENNTWTGNHLTGGGYGIRNQDGPNTFTNNVVPTLNVMAGNAAESGVQGTHPASKLVRVEGNRGTLLVGGTYNGFHVPARDTTGSHDGPIRYGLQVGTSVS
jgi:hypothetical protein